MEKTVDDSEKPLFGGLMVESTDQNQEIVLSLPRVKYWDHFDLLQYQRFWCPSVFIHGIIAFQKHFQALDSDIMLITFPKSGTTWLKALVYTIVNRSRHGLESSPLLSINPHELVPFIDAHLYTQNQSPDLEDFPTPRIFATHMPYASLPLSILNTNCRIIYLCRNPLDQFISEWHFFHRVQHTQTTSTHSLDEVFEKICQGIQSFGPYWEHILGFWKASLEQPNKILFLKYEDLKEDNVLYIKKIADFLGCPFSEEEVIQGVVEEMSKFCSFENMKNLEVNKTGRMKGHGPEYNIYFRKGEVGDWKNYLTPPMSECIEKLMEEKLDGSSLTFKK
ncbi:hypothetical protein ACOSQ2_031269 [Xanthoceras sorbifolium]